MVSALSVSIFFIACGTKSVLIGCCLLPGMVQGVQVKWLQKPTMAFVLLALHMSQVLVVC